VFSDIHIGQIYNDNRSYRNVCNMSFVSYKPFSHKGRSTVDWARWRHKELLRRAPRLSLALGPAPARAGPGSSEQFFRANSLKKVVFVRLWWYLSDKLRLWRHYFLSMDFSYLRDQFNRAPWNYNRTLRKIAWYFAGKMKGLAFIKDPDGYWIEILNPNMAKKLWKYCISFLWLVILCSFAFAELLQ